MAQENNRWSQVEDAAAEYEPIKYADVFNVAGELASKPISPRDAAAMRSAERHSLGETIRGGAAEIMQSAAKVNVQTGLVEPDETHSDQAIRVIKTDIDDTRIAVTEFAGDQVVEFAASRLELNSPPRDEEGDQVTVGEALEAAALSAGDKPVSLSDAAAIHAAETRVTGSKEWAPGGVSDEARVAADCNFLETGDEHKATLGDILADAKSKLSEDKAVTRTDAEAVMWAELRSNEGIHVRPGGVGESVAAAARLNMKMEQDK
ncbi:hypothetical protein V2J09_016857 [Rumex salicifolius]